MDKSQLWTYKDVQSRGRYSGTPLIWTLLSPEVSVLIREASLFRQIWPLEERKCPIQRGVHNISVLIEGFRCIMNMCVCVCILTALVAMGYGHLHVHTCTSHNGPILCSIVHEIQVWSVDWLCGSFVEQASGLCQFVRHECTQ